MPAVFSTTNILAMTMHAVFGTPNFLLMIEAMDAMIPSQHDVASFANFAFGRLVTPLALLMSSSAAAGP